jgi:hypothetical protein
MIHLGATKLLIGLYTWCLYDQCIDSALAIRIPLRSRGLREIETGRSRRYPAKVPFFLGFYPPTLWWSLDYPNINFPGSRSNCIVSFTHREWSVSDRPGRAFWDRSGLSQFRGSFCDTPCHFLRRREFPAPAFDGQKFFTSLSRFSPSLYNLNKVEAKRLRNSRLYVSYLSQVRNIQNMQGVSNA